ncbi:type II toxin-antitoxin system PemK/MazF family toxin [Pantoea sp. S62]|uniref:type II toxin-antitoxin system PemK/MazF family toxin n=1 Tax=Pantoea sp. S62 TaxID=2769342 RepID=UPI001914374E|nr:type II toxin-antitoxin system PemK/MazF family toxin [Pantoea sp. S62]MBK5017260.1 hypothetical protein [Pantoea sp. S62]
MAAVTIKYFLLGNKPQNDRLLGTKSIDDIEEVLIPISNMNKKKIPPFFITIKFSGNQCFRWRVQYVLGIAKNIWGIWLTEKDISDEVYLSQTLSMSRRSTAAQVARKGAIVIVEYGHIYQSLNFTNGLSDSSIYPCANQEGEMHKRRPAIIVSCDAWGAKVVPITSVEPDASKKNNAIFQLESQSTQNISEFTHGQNSFALCEMIQSVSYNRILPPLERKWQGTTRQYVRSQSYPRKLSPNDMTALDKGLLTAMGLANLQKTNDKFFAQIQSDKLIIEDLTQKHVDSSQEVDQLKAKYAALKKLYQAIGAADSDEAVEGEVDEWLKVGFDE